MWREVMVEWCGVEGSDGMVVWREVMEWCGVEGSDGGVVWCGGK